MYIHMYIHILYYIIYIHRIYVCIDIYIYMYKYIHVDMMQQKFWAEPYLAGPLLGPSTRDLAFLREFAWEDPPAELGR